MSTGYNTDKHGFDNWPLLHNQIIEESYIQQNQQTLHNIMLHDLILQTKVVLLWECQT